MVGGGLAGHFYRRLCGWMNLPWVFWSADADDGWCWFGSDGLSLVRSVDGKVIDKDR